MEKKGHYFFSIFTTVTNGFWVYWKQCLNLWSRRWMRPRHNLVRSLILYGLWILKILFAQGPMNLRRFFLNWETSWASKFPINFVPFRCTRRKKWILEVIVFYMDCRNIIAMSGFMNANQVRDQIEEIWWRVFI